jgi:EAL domain-containing protein (putative c-di-GMP-specific phosphodiesterase class I)
LRNIEQATGTTIEKMEMPTAEDIHALQLDRFAEQLKERLAFKGKTPKPAALRDFIEQIEVMETGRVIDCLALQNGLRMLAKYPDLRLSINMSARSIGYARWMRILEKGLGADPTIAERLILEITESSAMQVPELVTGFMARFQKQGVSFALDNFGAGFTSFKFLKTFYFDILKIDGTFIRDIANDADNQVLTAAMMNIGRQFDMVTVAQNVEKQADAAYLTALGIDCMQGYRFGAPTVRPPWLASDPARARA